LFTTQNRSEKRRFYPVCKTTGHRLVKSWPSANKNYQLIEGELLKTIAYTLLDALTKIRINDLITTVESGITNRPTLIFGF
jgi:hypothetical protein